MGNYSENIKQEKTQLKFWKKELANKLEELGEINYELFELESDENTPSDVIHGKMVEMRELVSEVCNCRYEIEEITSEIALLKSMED